MTARLHATRRSRKLQEEGCLSPSEKERVDSIMAALRESERAFRLRIARCRKLHPHALTTDLGPTPWLTRHPPLRTAFRDSKAGPQQQEASSVICTSSRALVIAASAKPSHSDGSSSVSTSSIGKCPQRRAFGRATHSTRRQNHKHDQTSVLLKWFEAHIIDPYPSHEEKETLAQLTKMTIRQVEHCTPRHSDVSGHDGSAMHRATPLSDASCVQLSRVH